jgi:hypothetical protein
MTAGPPLIDPRTYADLVAEVEGLAAQYTASPPATPTTPAAPGWQPAADGTLDAGGALVRVFSRLTEIAIARLNRLPERNFLAFLDLIGTRLEPPQAARVPLTFLLAAGSPGDALVPALTQVVATPLAGETEPVLFETERDLTVTRSRLVAAYTREPGRDLWTDATAVATGQAAGTFTPFRGTEAIAHRFYVGHAGLLGRPGVKDSVLVRITPAAADRPWLSIVSWEAWNGTGWQPLASTVAPEAGAPGMVAWRVTLPHLASLPSRTVGGATSSWLRGRLAMPLPSGLLTPSPRGDGELAVERDGGPAAGFTADASGSTYQPLDLAAPFLPFGAGWLLPVFYLALGQPLDKPASQVQIEIDVATVQAPLPGGAQAAFAKAGMRASPAADPGFAPVPAPDPSPFPAPPPVGVNFVWEYWDGRGWAALPGVAFQPGRGALGGGVFLDSGTVSFPQPAGWTSSPVHGVPGFWLRVRALPTSGGTASAISYQPPVMTRVRSTFRWFLPRIDGVSLSVHVTGTDRLPDLGFSNEIPVDLSKDFLPFGEKPRIGDTFYLASEEAFSQPGARVTLQVTPTNPGNLPGPPLPARASADLLLAWEFWDGRNWQKLGSTGPAGVDAGSYQFADGSAAFTATTGPWTVSFLCPAALPVTVAGKTGRFLRVRIATGNYGTEGSYRYPSLSALRLGWDYTSPLTPADYLATENDFVIAVETAGSRPAGTLLTPFLPPVDIRPTLYLGFERPAPPGSPGQPGAVTGFANRPTTLYFGVEPTLYDPAAAPRTVTEAAAVVWEYWNGVRWQRLGTRDETAGLSRRGLVTFLGPADFAASTEFGRTAFWLRARWERGDYAADPLLTRVLLNTTWGVHARTVAAEVLGGSRGERGQVFATARAPVLAGQRLEVVEPEVPSAADRVEIAADEGDAADPALALVPGIGSPGSQPAEVRVRWHEVPDFYASGPRSRHYTLDRATGFVRFGDGVRGLVPPPGRGNVRMAFYQAGGGPAGNRPAGNITRLQGTVPYVDGVVQPEPAAGGSAEEAVGDVQASGPRALRHRGRAAAAADFEDLALAASPEVARARAVPAHDGADAGRVGLVVVPRSDSPKPIPDVELLARVEDAVAARLSPAADLWTSGPDWLQVTVSAEIVPVAFDTATDVENAVRDRLAAFLHPLKGGFDGGGWAFGRKPYRSDLYAVIEGTPGVNHVRWLGVTEAADAGIARPERFLIFSGEHRITLAGSADDASGGAA